MVEHYAHGNLQMNKINLYIDYVDLKKKNEEKNPTKITKTYIHLHGDNM